MPDSQGRKPHLQFLQSIRGRLALLLALAFLPAGMIAFQSGVSSLQSRNAAIQGQEGVRALHRLSVLRDVATQLRESVRTLGASAPLFARDRRECDKILTDFAGHTSAPMVLALIDGDAVVQCSNVPNAHGVTANTARRRMISRARAGEDVVFDFIETPALSTGPVLAALVRAQTGPHGGDFYLGATQRVGPLLAQQRGPPSPGGRFAAVVSADGRILAGVEIGDGDRYANVLAQRVRNGPAASLRTAFEVGDKWAVATPLDPDATLYVVEGWAPAPMGPAGLVRALWALLGPLVLWAAAVGATWLAVEYFVARPLLVVEGLARTYARGEDAQADEALLADAPLEISSLRRTLAAMAKTLRGREARIIMALQEERALLLEVNHRVKNNLQMIVSILSIQARSAADPAEARGLARAQERVQLLALAHARIYESGEVRDIAFDQLTSDIVRTLVHSRGPGAVTINVDLDLAPIRTKVDRAVPLSFLIGESISSILDLNEEDGGVRSLSVALKPLDPDGFVLEIDARSDARALPAPSVASQRLTGAFARQIGASVEVDPSRPCFVRFTCLPAAELVDA